MDRDGIVQSIASNGKILFWPSPPLQVPHRGSMQRCTPVYVVSHARCSAAWLRTYCTCVPGHPGQGLAENPACTEKGDMSVRSRH